MESPTRPTAEEALEPATERRATQVFQTRQLDLWKRTDRMFAVLMVVQWFAGIAAALWLSPSTFTGTAESTHPHVWAAVLLGGALTAFPLFMVYKHPGTVATRHTIAVAQALTTALLIHLSGGRIETHFHVFGSLAFLAFYRDRSVLVSATIVTLADHIIRGLFWPESVYGVASATLWRSFEHAGWVVFELTFLFVAIKQSLLEMWGIARRQAAMESTTADIEQQVADRTAELQLAEQRTRAILETAADGIITIDHQGIVQTFNPAAKSIFGYTADEIIGKNVSMLMPSPDREAHDGYLAQYLTTGDAKVIGIGREVTGLRKDGSTFPLDLSVSESAGGVFTGIVRDITERKAIDRMKSEFVSTVSHELRTPLTSIHGSLGLLEGGVAGEIPASAASLIQIALKNSDRLVRLVNDILDMEKIESGKMDFRMETQDLRAIVDEAITANASYAQQHDVTIQLESELENAMVTADRDRLIQVMTNLLSNAAKFSPPDDSVTVALQRQGDSYLVEVSDHGDGIPVEFQDKIFHRFAQADSSDIRQKGGTGLGLSISQAIVERHDGDIGFRTEPGNGTTFHVSIPALVAKPGYDMPSSRTDLDDRPRILVCEDDPDVAHLLVLMMERNGMAADVATDAEQAEELLGSEDYDAMTLDLLLPGKSGIELLRQLRSNPATRDLPIVVVSATAEEGRAETEKDTLGVISWIDKPIDRDDLAQAVTEAVGFGATPDVAPGRPRVLHVEDDDDLAEVVGATLRPVVEVTRVKDLASARDLLERADFDVVLLDLELPDGFGLELLPALNRGRRSIPVVVFSAREPESEIADRVAASLVKSRTSNRKLIETLTSLVKRGIAAPTDQQPTS